MEIFFMTEKIVEFYSTSEKTDTGTEEYISQLFDSMGTCMQLVDGGFLCCRLLIDGKTKWWIRKADAVTMTFMSILNALKKRYSERYL